MSEKLKISAWKFTIAQDARVKRIAEVERVSVGKMYRILVDEALDEREGVRARRVAATQEPGTPALEGLDRAAWEPPGEPVTFIG